MTEGTSGASGDHCCSASITSGASAQGPAETLTTQSLTRINASMELPAATRCSCPTHPDFLARDYGASPIYLLTGRLRR